MIDKFLEEHKEPESYNHEFELDRQAYNARQTKLKKLLKERELVFEKLNKAISSLVDQQIKTRKNMLSFKTNWNEYAEDNNRVLRQTRRVDGENKQLYDNKEYLTKIKQ